MWGGGREKAPFERVNPELGGGERSKARVRKPVKMGSGDASDAMDAELCIISIMKIMKGSGDNFSSPEQGRGTVQL